MTHRIIGIDISKKTFNVAALNPNNKYKHKVFQNDSAGFQALIEWLKLQEGDSFHFCMEATGIYNKALAAFLYEKGFLVSVENPAKIAAFARSELARNKTDKADAALIARFCRAFSPSPWKPEPLHIQELQALLSRFEALQDLIRQEENRLQIASNITRPSIEAVLAVLNAQFIEIKNKIKKHINDDPDLKSKKELLLSIPGIGETTIAVILAFVSDASKFESARHMASFVGLNPKQRQSGSSVYKKTRLSKTGNAKLRKALFLPAVVATRYNPILKSTYQRLLAAGKPKMCAIGAVMRKLTHIIYGILKSGKPFDPQILSTM